MGVISAALKHMLAAGMDPDAIVAAVEDMEAGAVDPGPELTPRQARNRRYYEKHKGRFASARSGHAASEKASEKRLKASEQDVSDADSVSPEGSPPTPPSPNPHPVKKNPPTGVKKKNPSPRDELETVLDEMHADAVLDHRQRLRKPLTAHAAHLLAGKLARCPDPNAAADLMIEKGWQSIEPDWAPVVNGNGSSQARASPDELEKRRDLYRSKGLWSEKWGDPPKDITPPERKPEPELFRQ